MNYLFLFWKFFVLFWFHLFWFNVSIDNNQLISTRKARHELMRSVSIAEAKKNRIEKRHDSKSSKNLFLDHDCRKLKIACLWHFCKTSKLKTASNMIRLYLSPVARKTRKRSLSMLNCVNIVHKSICLFFAQCFILLRLWISFNAPSCFLSWIRI